jgi:1,4-dihydroxy-2-naphthoate octaprenyltransferase
VAFIAACLLGTMGLALTTAVAASGGDVGPATAGVLLLAQVLAWFYSAPPLVLHSRGLGEAATAVVVTGLTPLVAFMLQSGDLHVAAQGVRALALALIPLLGLQFAMLLAIEFPDAVGDAATGKRTLVVRLGGMRAAALLRAILVVVYGSIPLLVRAGMPPLVAIGAIVGGPLAALQFVRVGAGEWAHARGWDALTARGVALVAVTAAGELAGFACVLLRV